MQKKNKKSITLAFKMPIEIELSQKVIDDLFAIYENAAGTDTPKHLHPKLEGVIQQLTEYGGHFEYRIGSKWSPNSKFTIDKYNGIYFDPNHNPRSNTERKQIEKAVELFRDKVTRYLLDTSISSN